MNDRLGDVPSWALEDDEQENTEPTSPQDNVAFGGGDIEMAETASKQPKHMEHFFREVESIKDDIEAVIAGKPVPPARANYMEQLTTYVLPRG